MAKNNNKLSGIRRHIFECRGLALLPALEKQFMDSIISLNYPTPKSLAVWLADQRWFCKRSGSLALAVIYSLVARGKLLIDSAQPISPDSGVSIPFNIMVDIWSNTLIQNKDHRFLDLDYWSPGEINFSFHPLRQTHKPYLPLIVSDIYREKSEAEVHTR